MNLVFGTCSRRGWVLSWEIFLKAILSCFSIKALIFNLTEMYCFLWHLKCIAFFIKILKDALVCWEIKAWFNTFTVAEASRFEKEEDYVRGWHLIQFFFSVFWKNRHPESFILLSFTRKLKLTRILYRSKEKATLSPVRNYKWYSTSGIPTLFLSLRPFLQFRLFLPTYFVKCRRTQLELNS